MSDSLSSLSSPHHPISQRILVISHSLLSQSTQVTFLWIPGHVNITEHDLVDASAKSATNLPKISYPTNPPLSDLKNLYNSYVNSAWNSTWSEQTTNKLFQIKHDTIPWSSSNRDSRREETVLARLRIGHTRLTHSHILYTLSFPLLPNL